MSLGVIAKIKIQDGKNAEFEKVFADLAAAVRENEPGNNFYALHKSKTDPLLYVVLENYKDAAAFAAHREYPHFKEGGKKMGACMAGAPEVELLDGV
ncbi:MAG: putative quinol monooxygenase [Alphaproteobacteria bacterium]|nr:putative quinol monooxygenase [Alphaproteobacteria bacterium]MDP1671049.1 putative quinol monooxygenase [Alphaproteobacteria bacterium]